MIETIRGLMDEADLQHRHIVTDTDTAYIVRDEWHYQGVEVKSNVHVTVKNGKIISNIVGDLI